MDVKKLNGEEGEIGISSLLIFVSTITISALVGGLMISSTVLMTDGIEASLDDIISDMYPSIEVVSGYAVTNYTSVQELCLKIQTSTSLQDVNLSTMMVETFDGNYDCNLTASSLPSNSTFGVVFLRDVGNTSGVMEYGDLVSIKINLSYTNQTLLPGEVLEIVFYPLDGSILAFSYTAPDLLGVKLIPLSV
jgi:archaellin